MILYAFNGSLLKGFTAYHLGRKQRVTISGSLPELPFLTSGVPQRSILGPHYVLLYINNLRKVAPFADVCESYVENQSPVTNVANVFHCY